MVSQRIPQIIAHRGASGDYPEHCIEGYQEALQQGAEFIELDLVFTKDRHLIVRHDIFLSTTTNVSKIDRFADRKRTHPLMAEITGDADKEDWFAEDFTLQELKTLKVRQPWDKRSKAYDDQYQIPTFYDAITFLDNHNRAHGRSAGLYFDTKHAAYFEGQGYDFAAALARDIDRAVKENVALEYYAQSFEIEMLEKINNVMDAHLIFLFERTSNELRFDISKLIQIIEKYHDYVDSVGVEKNLLIGENCEPTVLMEALQKRKVGVIPWTFRDDYLPSHWRSADEEYAAYFSLGVDALFTDFPAHAMASREKWLNTYQMK